MWEAELRSALSAARSAAAEILEVYRSGDFHVELKADLSPVTRADKASDALIRSLLKKDFPDYAFLSEESVDDRERLGSRSVWIIDPLDGTKEFIAHNGEFSVNVALAHDHEPVVGVIWLPAKDEGYFAVRGKGAFHLDAGGHEERIRVDKKDDDLTVLVSRFHLHRKEQQLIEEHEDKIKHIVTVGAALKGCLIASGKAEVSYRFSPQTKEWDTAAMQLIVEEAGGVMIKPDGERILYNRSDVYNRDGYVIANKRSNVLL